MVFSSAVAAQQIYANSVSAEVSRTPFVDSSFDFSCSCFVLEQLPPLIAAVTLREMLRVLRPGGKFIALMDLHCDRPFLRRVREQHPTAYQGSIIDFPGYRGLVSATQWHKAVTAVGFKIRVWRQQSRVPISDLATYAYFASSPSAPQHLRLLGKGALWLAHKSSWGSMYQIGLTLLDDLCGWILPRRWALRVLFVLEKPQE